MKSFIRSTPLPEGLDSRILDFRIEDGLVRIRKKE
jgi:hypothetical protein